MRTYLYISYLILIYLTISCQRGDYSDLAVVELRAKNLVNPTIIQTEKPTFSWKLKSGQQGQNSIAYQILVSNDKESLSNDIGNLWDSGKIFSSQCVAVEYRGKELPSDVQCYWKVRVWNQDDVASDWSETAHWDVGPDEFHGSWIAFTPTDSNAHHQIKAWANGMSQPGEYVAEPCPYFRKLFQLTPEPERIYQMRVAARGVYTLYVNGHRISDNVLGSGWPDYSKRTYYNSHDITEFLVEGENAVGIVLAPGWYSGVIYNRGMHFYGDQPMFMAELHMGDSDYITTDASWSVRYLGHMEADIQGGESYDARNALPEWNTPSLTDTNWLRPVLVEGPTRAEPYPAPPVRPQRQLRCVSLKEISEHEYIADMGQNFAGWARIKVSGSEGDSVVMRFGEVLNPDGSLHTRNLRTARATDTYVLKGDGIEVWEPQFTYHGFRYIEIKSDVPIMAENITGIVLSSNLPKTGDFQCSNELINRLQSNILSSMRSNYLEIPTDCPQRDERLGWAGDAQLFLKTGMYNVDNQSFMIKWLDALADGQFEDGRIPNTAPAVATKVSAGWSDAIVSCPWELFQFYGDTNVLKRYYPNMIRWLDYLEQKNPEHISLQGSYGDWHNVDSETPTKVVSTAYYKQSVDLMVKISTVLGDDARAVHYEKLADKIQGAFMRELVDDSAHIEGRTQCGYLLALAYDLVSDSLKQMVSERLVESILAKDTHLSTGIIGTKHLLPVLSQIGANELAYKLLLKESYPSWGYQISQGATTTWERWDGMTKESGLNSDSTNSFNHYALGSVGEWFYESIAGIAPLEPGFKRVLIAPNVGGDLTFANANYNCAYGRIESNWVRSESGFELFVRIPPNTKGLVHLPIGDAEMNEEVLSRLADMPGVKVAGIIENALNVEIESGAYRFRSDY